MNTEMFRTGNNSSVQEQALELAAMLFEEGNGGSNESTLNGGAIAGIIIGLIAIVLLLAFVVLMLVLVIHCRHVSKRYTILHMANVTPIIKRRVKSCIAFVSVGHPEKYKMLRYHLQRLSTRILLLKTLHT